MRILSQQNSSNTNFKNLIISYNAFEKLSRRPHKELVDILKVGKIFDKTEYIDIELLSDLKFRIKEKGNIYSSITEPIKVIKPLKNKNKVRIVGVYNGPNDGNKKAGDICHKYIQYSSPEEAMKGYERINANNSNTERIELIAKEMEQERILRQEKEYEEINKHNKLPILQTLFNKHGDIVKEWKEEII